MAKTMKYHINPETGRPNQCTATVRGCKYAVNGEMPEHYNSKEEAREAYENQNQDKIVQSVKKDNDAVAKVTKSDKSGTNLDKPSVQEIIDSPEYQKNYRMASLIQIKAMEAEKENEKNISHRDTLMNNHDKVDQWGVRTILERVNSNNERYGSDKQFNLEDYSIKTPLEGQSGAYSITYDKERFKNDLNEFIEVDMFRKVSESSQKAHKSEVFLSNARKGLQERLGYTENPRFGVPTGESTLEKWQGRQAKGYSSLPTRNVPVLKDAQKYCKKCNQTLVAKDDALSRRYVHENGSDRCKNGDFKQESITCKYCGTSDSQMVSSAQQAWSDEISCKRCGGVDGYGIGD